LPMLPLSVMPIPPTKSMNMICQSIN